MEYVGYIATFIAGFFFGATTMGLFILVKGADRKSAKAIEEERLSRTK
jgi:hypothetical protein